MKLLRRYLWLAAALLLTARPSVGAQDVEMRVSCPAQATAGSTIETDLRFENRRCVAADIRLSSSIAGNPLGSFGAIGIFGPEVADSMITVPAGTGPFCTSPPGIRDVAVSTPPAIPASLVGTVATFFLIAEWDDGVTGGTMVKECMVNVLCFGEPDLDDDGVGDVCDNCQLVPNPGQQNANSNAFGDACDCDFNRDGIANIADFNLFLPDFIAGLDSGLGSDMNSDGIVNIADFNLFLPCFIAGVPGP